MFRLEAYGTSISFETSKTNFEEANKEFENLCKLIGLVVGEGGDWALIDEHGEEVLEK